jgi:hypothetical protein
VFGVEVAMVDALVTDCEYAQTGTGTMDIVINAACTMTVQNLRVLPVSVQRVNIRSLDGANITATNCDLGNAVNEDGKFTFNECRFKPSVGTTAILSSGTAAISIARGCHFDTNWTISTKSGETLNGGTIQALTCSYVGTGIDDIDDVPCTPPPKLPSHAGFIYIVDITVCTKWTRLYY